MQRLFPCSYLSPSPELPSRVAPNLAFPSSPLPQSSLPLPQSSKESTLTFSCTETHFFFSIWLVNGSTFPFLYRPFPGRTFPPSPSTSTAQTFFCKRGFTVFTFFTTSDSLGDLAPFPLDLFAIYLFPPFTAASRNSSLHPRLGLGSFPPFSRQPGAPLLALVGHPSPAARRWVAFPLMDGAQVSSAGRQPETPPLSFPLLERKRPAKALASPILQMDFFVTITSGARA